MVSDSFSLESLVFINLVVNDNDAHRVDHLVELLGASSTESVQTWIVTEFVGSFLTALVSDRALSERHVHLAGRLDGWLKSCSSFFIVLGVGQLQDLVVLEFGEELIKVILAVDSDDILGLIDVEELVVVARLSYLEGLLDFGFEGVVVSDQSELFSFTLEDHFHLFLFGLFHFRQMKISGKGFYKIF